MTDADTINRIYFDGRRMNIGAQGSPGYPGYAYRVRFIGHLIDGARSRREAAMTSTTIKWTRSMDGLYVSDCGRYEIARTVRHNNPAHTAWVPYYMGTVDGAAHDTRLTDMHGKRLLADAKRACTDHRA